MSFSIWLQALFKLEAILCAGGVLFYNCAKISSLISAFE